jgi:Glycosyl hydrolases family 16
MVAKYTPLNFCVEARYQIPATPGSWPAFYFYGSTHQNTDSEIDVEQPVTLNGSQGVYDVSLNDHPTKGTIVRANPDFTTRWMIYHSSIDFSAAPHYYTVCYNDNANTTTKWIDGRHIYTAANWKWSGRGLSRCPRFAQI